MSERSSPIVLIFDAYRFPRSQLLDLFGDFTACQGRAVQELDATCVQALFNADGAS